MKQFVSGIIMVILLLTFGLPVFGAAWKVAGGNQLIAKDQVATGDYIFTGDRLEVNGVIDGDLLVFGNSAVVNGRVTGSILGLVNQELVINGSVGRDIRVAAQQVTLKGAVARNVTALAMRLETGRQSKIGLGLLGKFVDLRLAGDVAGPVAVTANNQFRLSGRIGGDLVVKGSPVQWRAPLEVGGNVTDYTIEPSNPNQVKGVTLHKDYTLVEEQGGGTGLLLMLGWFFGTLILSIVVYRLFPRTTWAMTEPTRVNFRKNLLVGFLSMIGLGFLIIVSLGVASFYGVSLPLVVLLGLVFLLLWFLSGILVNIWLGRLFFKSRLKPVLTIVMGGLISASFSLVPLLNLAAGFIVMCVGFGMALRNIRFEFREPQIDYRA